MTGKKAENGHEVFSFRESSRMITIWRGILSAERRFSSGGRPAHIICLSFQSSGNCYQRVIIVTETSSGMADPQPSNVHEGMDAEDAPPPPPASGEDRKAAAAMSSLESRGNDDEVEAKKPNRAIDQDALGAAISRLELVDKAGKVGKAESEKKAKEKEEVAQRAKVKVDQADVTLLVC